MNTIWKSVISIFVAIFSVVSIGLAQGNYTSLYEASHHLIFVITISNNIIELDDGSEWRIQSSDIEKAKEWDADDVVVVTPSSQSGQSFDYVMDNLTVNDKAQVTLLDGPKMGGLYARFVLEVDVDNGEFVLDDGVRCDVFAMDIDFLESWCEGDPIIVGVSAGSFVGGEQYIFINSNTENYVRGDIE